MIQSGQSPVGSYIGRPVIALSCAERQRTIRPLEFALTCWWRRQGLDWGAIAAEVGGTPEALRKKLARAVDRVARELHLDHTPHE